MQRCLAHRSIRLLAAPHASSRSSTAAAAPVARRPTPKRLAAAPPLHRRWLHIAAPGSDSSVGAMTVHTAPPPADIKPQLLSVAPMMDWTDVYYRQLARMISRHTWLYTEMVVDQTILHNPNTDKFLWFPPEQRPIVCQLGGSNPELLARAAKMVEAYGYDEININCGCPSDRVAGAGCFGAALMLKPELVAACCKAMGEAVSTPITVKCRLGVDNFDTYPELTNFIKVVSEGSGVTHFIIHARKCLLKGLNPHQNRSIPPLRYEWVWALKRDFPHLDFSLNGGVLSLEETAAALRTLNGGGSGGSCSSEGGGGGGGGDAPAGSDGGHGQAPGGGADGASSGGEAATAAAGASSSSAGIGASSSGGRQGILGVMVGRAAYNMPWDALANADVAIFGAEQNAATSRRQVLRDYATWADSMIGHWRVDEDGYKSPNVRTLVKPLLGIFHGEPRAKKWRAAVDEALKTAQSVSEVLELTLPVLKPDSLDAPPRPLRQLPPRLAHYADELPPTPEELVPPRRGYSGHSSSSSPAAGSSVEGSGGSNGSGGEGSSLAGSSAEQQEAALTVA